MSIRIDNTSTTLWAEPVLKSDPFSFAHLQRVAIARAFLRQPRLLICDEVCVPLRFNVLLWTAASLYTSRNAVLDSYHLNNAEYFAVHIAGVLCKDSNSIVFGSASFPPHLCCIIMMITMMALLFCRQPRAWTLGLKLKLWAPCQNWHK